MAVADQFDTVQKLFIAFYQRPADPGGLRFWAQRVEAAGNEAAVIDAFANSAEATDLYGPINSDTIGDVIDGIYQALFNRAPDEAGKAYYIQAFQSGEITAGNIALAVLNAAQNDDALAIQNKLEVANEFTAQVDGRDLTDPAFGTGSTFAVTYDADDVEAARDILAGVTADPATVLSPADVTDVLKEQIADEGDAIENENSGNTFTLTVGVDTVAGTNANDVINALSVNPSTGVEGTTLNAFDSIDGGAGRDTLNVYLATGVNQQQLGSVKNVEVVNVYAGEAVGEDGEATLTGDADVSKYQGVEEFWQIGAATNVVELGEGTTAGFRNITDGGLRVEAAAAATSASVALDNVSDSYVDVYGDKLSSVSVALNNVGDDSSIYVWGGAVSSVTVTGSVVDADEDGVDPIYLDIESGEDEQTLTINTAVAAYVDVDPGDKLSTIDASASTGDIIIEAVVGKITTGSGNDFVLSEGVPSLTNKFDGGEGIDTFVVGGTSFVTQQYDALKQIVNFENLAFYDAATVDAAQLASFKDLHFWEDDSTVNNLAADQTVTAVDVANITVNNAAETVNVVLQDDVASNYIEEDDGATTTQVFVNTGDNKITGGTLVVSGDAGLEFTNGAEGGRTFATIDLSDLTGNSNMTAAAAQETFVLGAGADELIVATSTLGKLDVIQGFDSVIVEGDDTDVVDTLWIDESTQITGRAVKVDVTAAESLLQAWEIAAENAGESFVTFQFEGNTYVFADTDEGSVGAYDNSDFALQIIGLHDLTSANDAYTPALV